MARILRNKRNGELCVLCLALIAMMSIACYAPVGAAANPNSIRHTETRESSSMSTRPTHESSANSTGPYPTVNGHTIYPPLAPKVSPPNYSALWYAGAVYPLLAYTYYDATSVYVTITVPNSAPLSDEFYYVLLSAWDSAGSYDQIGFSGDYGVWGLSYSWTNGNPAYQSSYIYNADVMNLSPGATYTFDISVASGTAQFSAYQGLMSPLTQIWSLSAPTGGDSLILANYYFEYGAFWSGYTNYLEVHDTHVSGGAPLFTFNFYDNYFVDNGATYATPWNTWSSNAPSYMQEQISGNSVTVIPPSPPTITCNPTSVYYGSFQDPVYVTWTPSGLGATTYTITGPKGTTAPQSWTSGTGIKYDVGGLGGYSSRPRVLTYYFTFTAYNALGESSSYTLTVKVACAIWS